MSQSIFNNFDYNFDSSKFGAGLNLSQASQNTLAILANNSNISTWQLNAIANNSVLTYSANNGTYVLNRTQFYQNPTATPVSALITNLNTIYSTANTISAEYVALLQPSISALANTVMADATNCIISLNKFLSHTNNVSGVSANTGNTTIPSLDLITSVGNQLTTILNKSDGIANTVGMLGCMTSLFVVSDLNANNTSLSVDSTNLTNSSSANVLANLTQTDSDIVSLNNMVTTRRNGDWVFYQQAVQTVLGYASIASFGNPSPTQAYLINNVIGTPFLQQAIATNGT
jgi:hypothetical protein